MTRQRRAQRRDALAAAWILQSALDGFQIGPGTEDADEIELDHRHRIS